MKTHIRLRSRKFISSIQGPVGFKWFAKFLLKYGIEPEENAILVQYISQLAAEATSRASDDFRRSFESYITVRDSQVVRVSSREGNIIEVLRTLPKNDYCFKKGDVITIKY